MEKFQVPEFEEATFGAPLNKVVRCKSKFGWHLVQVLSERLKVCLIPRLFSFFFKKAHFSFLLLEFRDGSSLRDIGPEELHSKMEDPEFFEEAQLIDVREPDEMCVSI